MYQFKEKIDYHGHFWFDRKLIEFGNWGSLPLSSKSVFPVIASFSNAKGECFPGETTIAILSGISEKTVRKGIKHLEDFPGFRYSDYITRTGRRSKKFFIDRPPEYEHGRAFPFYKSFFEGGNWSLLRHSARALYPVLRNFGVFNSEVFEFYSISELQGDANLEELKEVYANRKWEYCEAEIDIISDLAGISKRSGIEALKNLSEHFFIEEIKERQYFLRGWKVFLRPPEIYKRDYLNKTISKRFGGQFDK